MSLKKTTQYGKPRQQGFSLVEVLIALVIMSVGMLGIAGLYVQSMQAGRTSMFRHNAVTLAGDIADRIRANPRAGAAYTGDGAGPEPCDDGSTDCDEAEMAVFDISRWKAQADATLPAGDVTVTFDNLVFPNEYTINVTWTEPQGPLNYAIKIPVLGI